MPSRHDGFQSASRSILRFPETLAKWRVLNAASEVTNESLRSKAHPRPGPSGRCPRAGSPPSRGRGTICRAARSDRGASKMPANVHAVVQNPDDHDRVGCLAIEDQVPAFPKGAIAGANVVACCAGLAVVDEEVHARIETTKISAPLRHTPAALGVAADLGEILPCLPAEPVSSIQGGLRRVLPRRAGPSAGPARSLRRARSARRRSVPRAAARA